MGNGLVTTGTAAHTIWITRGNTVTSPDIWVPVMCIAWAAVARTGSSLMVSTSAWRRPI
jgi:hypothetical protein